MQPNSEKKIKVALGMSGGVDSSVAALLLKKSGYEVVGLFMKLWHDSSCDVARENSCCDDQAERDARKVAKILGIQFYVVDARKPFKKEITDYFIDEYKNLRTPNPCVLCNKKIKFGWLLDFAEKLGCDFLATGHYARIVNDEANIKGQNPTSNQIPNINSDLTYGKNQKSDRKFDNEIGNYHLLRGIDSDKDQSYFLYQLDQTQLSKILFPLGELTKTEVRAIAKKNNLPVYEKVESQEICFIQDKDYRDFLKRYLPETYFKPGVIVDKDGYTVGRHSGLVNYTIGQRKGITQTLPSEKSECRQPLYVIGFNKDKNQLIAGGEKDLYQDETEISDLHFINPKPKEEYLNQNLTIKIRSRAKEIGCSLLNFKNSNALIKFSEPQRAVTPGQSAVLYLGDEIIGGGVIIK